MISLCQIFKGFLVLSYLELYRACVTRNFPEGFGRLRSLKELVANGNRLQQLPESFGALISLGNMGA